jgi:hypothetical protein
MKSMYEITVIILTGNVPLIWQYRNIVDFKSVPL